MDNFELDSSIYPNGTVIADRFQITSFLAQGGMAQVYTAKQQLFGDNSVTRDVALKILLPSFSMNPDIVMRFFREAKANVELNHPNTVRLYDMGETPDNRLFLAMELLKGEELSERIKKGVIAPKEALAIARQVAGSLSEAHQHGIIHRDLKPDNIFLTSMNVVKVLDFGIAKLKDDSDQAKTERRLTKAGTAPGTPEYMSPEQARGKNLDARSDLYSLGIVIYEMLCGRPPFEEATFLGTILMQVQAAPPPLPESVPLQLRNYVINRLLAKDPNCRPDNADVFIHEIDDLSRKLKLDRTAEEEEDLAQLDKAKAEIESLRSQLAQTRLELLRSTEMSVIPDNMVYPTTPPPVRTTLNGSSIVNVDRDGSINYERDTKPDEAVVPDSSLIAPQPLHHQNRAGAVPQSMGRIPVPPRQSAAIGAGTPASARPPAMQRNMPAMPQQSRPQNASFVQPNAMIPSAPTYPQSAPDSAYSQNHTRQNGSQITQSSAYSQNAQNPAYSQPGMQMTSGYSGVTPAVHPSDSSSLGAAQSRIPDRPPVSRRAMPGMPGRNSTAHSPRSSASNAMNTASASHFYGTPIEESADVEPIEAPSPRHAPKPAQPDRITLVDGIKDEELALETSTLGRQMRDAHFGMQTKTASLQDHETIFMQFAQPLCSKLGPSKTGEALELSRSIWNAAVMGPGAISLLLQSATDQPNLFRLVELMAARHEKLFSNENWVIESIRLIPDQDGKYKIKLTTI